MKTNYFYQAAKENNVSVKEYLSTAEYNYVIVEGDKVVTWNSNDCPVIFGDYGDAVAELSNWCAPIRNVSIITEKEMLETYCKKDYEEGLKYNDYEEIMNIYNAHNPQLVKTINKLWNVARDRFRIILVALMERDAEEMLNGMNSCCFGWDETADVEYVRLCVTGNLWEDYAYDYLMHVADDGDLETIINFIRYREDGKLITA